MKIQQWNSTLKADPTKRLKRTPLRRVSKKTAKLWDSARKECLKQYPVCFLCGGKAEHCHHWKFTRTQRPDLKYDQDNLIMLCSDCHYHNGADDNFYELKQQILDKKGK